MQSGQQGLQDDVHVQEQRPIFNLMPIARNPTTEPFLSVRLAAPAFSLSLPSDSGFYFVSGQVALDDLIKKVVSSFCLKRVRARLD
jgi:hypothetical protein